MKVRNNGEFWCSEMDQNKILEKLSYVNNLSQEQWFNILNKPGLRSLLGRDEGNRKLLGLLENNTLKK